jgi:hypothetical protein
VIFVVFFFVAVRILQDSLAQFTAQNSPRTIYRAQFIAGTIHRGSIHRWHNSPRTIHREKIKIPLDAFLILLDSAR